MFSFDRESPVDEVELKFLHPALDGYWDWPTVLDQKKVPVKYLFFGPCIPDPPKKFKGFRFRDEDEERAQVLYRLIKKNSKSSNQSL